LVDREQSRQDSRAPRAESEQVAYTG
jgi:hypothetical protein